MLVIWLKKGGGEGGPIMSAFGGSSVIGAKLRNRIQVLPKAPCPFEQIQLRAGGGGPNGFHIWSLMQWGLSSSEGGKECDLASDRALLCGRKTHRLSASHE